MNVTLDNWEYLKIQDMYDLNNNQVNITFRRSLNINLRCSEKLYQLRVYVLVIVKYDAQVDIV